MEPEINDSNQRDNENLETPEKNLKTYLYQSNNESFPRENSHNTNENVDPFNEIKLINSKFEHKPRYPTLEIDTKQIETQEIFTKNEDSLFPEENTKFLYTSLKDRKAEFSSFLNNLGWKSKSYLKKIDEREREAKLQFQDKQEYIKMLNANVCDLKESEGFIKQSIEKFRDEEEKRERFIQPNIKENVCVVEKKLKEKMKNFREQEKQKRQFLEFDLEFVLTNAKYSKNKNLY